MVRYILASNQTTQLQAVAGRTLFKNILSPPPLPISAQILKFWNCTQRRHRLSRKSLMSHCCYWQSWGWNLGLAANPSFLHKVLMGWILPASWWQSTFTAIQKHTMSWKWQVCILKECLMLFNVGLMVGLTHSTALETQITNVRYLAILKVC